MIDFNVIERRCSEAIRNGYGKHPVIECADAESVMELITRLRQAEKDAARYRWLRDECRHEYGVDDLFNGSSDSIDKRIDAAMIEE